MKNYLCLFIMLSGLYACGSDGEGTVLVDSGMSPETEQKLLEVIKSAENGDTVSMELLDELQDGIEKDRWYLWKKVVDEKGGFMATFPAKPNQEYTTQIIEDREVQWVSYSANMQKAEKSDENLAYQITYTDDKILANPESFGSFVQQQISYIERTIHCSLETDKVVDMGPGVKCREQVYTLTGKGIQAKYRLVAREGRLYTILVLTDNANLFNYSIEHFFTSFKLTEIPEIKAKERAV